MAYFPAEISHHLEMMLQRIRDDDQIMMAAKLESPSSNRSKYLTLIYSNVGNDGSEVAAALIGFDIMSQVCTNDGNGDEIRNDYFEYATIGLAIGVNTETRVRLTGDGSFETSVGDRFYAFKPIAVQVMWACLHSISDAKSRASCGSNADLWLEHYAKGIDSEYHLVKDWKVR